MSTLLVFSSGPLAGQRVPVETDLLIGREDAQVVVDDPEVSRHHAVLRNTDHGLQIEDLGSRNGTFVNDQRIPTATTLVAGDTVRIGQTLFHVELDSAGETVIASTPGATVFAARPTPEEAVPEAVVSAESVAAPAPVPAPPPAPVAAPAAPPPAPKIASPPPSPNAAPPQFAAAAPPRRAPARVASRQAPAVMITFLIIIATGIALAAYFATR